MSALEKLRDELPDVAKDIKVNLQTVLGSSSLSEGQKWGIAYATAIASRHPRLREAVREDAAAAVDAAVLEDARAAAVLMGMYAAKPARLRMQRLAQPATSKVDFELYCLAVSAVNGCEQCLQSHERVVLDGGLSEDHVNDAVRIASTMHAAAVALELA